MSELAPIEPETKDWTWVLERPCPQCGCPAGTIRSEELAAAVRAVAASWRELLDAGAITTRRPEPKVWSPLEYACHSRDVLHRFDERARLILTEDSPTFEFWDQDAAAVEERYNEQDPAAVVDQIRHAAEVVHDLLDSVSGEQWERLGHRADGAPFTVLSVSRYKVHDLVHHLWDVRT